MKKVFAILVLLMPIFATADEQTTCTKLIADIMHNYEVSSLQTIMHSHTPNNEYVNCVYSAVVHEVYGNRPTQVEAQLNTTNHMFTVEIR